MNECNRENIPNTLPDILWCKHCGKEGQACSRICFGKYVLKRCLAIEHSLEWEEMYKEYAATYYEATEFAAYIEESVRYKAKFIDIQEFKDSLAWNAGWVPECMEELFLSFKYFYFDNCKKRNMYGERNVWNYSWRNMTVII